MLFLRAIPADDSPSAGSAPKTSQEEQKNVILISLDTLRRERLGCYGNRRNCSPAFDRLTAKGALFQNTIAPSPWTLPSHVSLFTSLYPSYHGLQYLHDLDALRPWLSHETATLAELLRDRGYRTMAIVEGGVVSPAFNLLQGFENIITSPKRDTKEIISQRGLTVTIPVDQAAGTFAAGIHWIEQKHTSPFLLFLHTYETHLPYHENAFSKSYAPDYRGRIKYGRTDEYREISEEAKVRTAIDKGEVAHMRAQYDGHISMVDIWIERLFRTLEQTALRKNTLVIITSDHGEYLLDRDFRIEHGQNLYGPLVNVPLLISDHDRIPAGRTIHSYVSLVDIPPTILDYLGVSIPPEMQGVSLMPLLKGQSLPRRYLFSDAPIEGKQVAVIDTASDYKYLYTILDERRELYHLESDPRETDNLNRKERAKAQALHRELLHYLRENDTGYYLVIENSGGNAWEEIRIRPGSGGRIISAWNIGLRWLEERRGHTYTAQRNGLVISSEGAGPRTGYYILMDGTASLTIEMKGAQKNSRLPLSVGNTQSSAWNGTATLSTGECRTDSFPPFSRDGIFLFTFTESQPEQPYSAKHPRPPDTPDQNNNRALDEATKEKLRALGYIN